MKWIIYIALAVAAAMMCACDNSKFSIVADIENMGNQNVHVVFLGDSGVHDSFIPTQDNKFGIEGNSQELTVVSVLDSQNKPLFRVAVRGGEKVKVTGDLRKPHEYECEGSETAQEWMKFEKEHAALYDTPDRTALDRAIEQYVHDNPSSVVSALLLVHDYSDQGSDQAKKLLASLDESARPASLVSSMQRLHDAATARPITQLHPMMLCGTTGDFEALQPATSRSTFIYWWLENNPARHAQVSAIRQIASKHGGDVTVADVSLAPDSIGWQYIIKSDSAAWKHYWAPGGILDPSIRDLHITSVPLCIVTDSMGRQLYRGNDIPAAQKALEKYLGK
ncbi:hypothetical protein [Sodaliphilus sp.]|uniref:hypothetical protein n=1 Tax=Sodaliphilus sp. TaxID=2815818 RepID=UPI003890679D